MNYAYIHMAFVDELEKIAVSPAWVAQKTLAGAAGASPARLRQFGGRMDATGAGAAAKGVAHTQVGRALDAGSQAGPMHPDAQAAYGRGATSIGTANNAFRAAGIAHNAHSAAVNGPGMPVTPFRPPGV